MPVKKLKLLGPLRIRASANPFCVVQGNEAAKKRRSMRYLPYFSLYSVIER
jgi:hypothetical protein